MFVVTGTARAPLVAQKTQHEPIRPIKVWTGKASWYGIPFHGRITANGEVYDMHGPTAAHRHLPLGSVVRLVNPKNGRARVVRINDRGPYIDGREIDVSLHIAQELGFEHNGLARLRIELLEVPPRRQFRQVAAD